MAWFSADYATAVYAIGAIMNRATSLQGLYGKKYSCVCDRMA